MSMDRNHSADNQRRSSPSGRAPACGGNGDSPEWLWRRPGAPPIGARWEALHPSEDPSALPFVKAYPSRPPNWRRNLNQKDGRWLHLRKRTPSELICEGQPGLLRSVSGRGFTALRATDMAVDRPANFEFRAWNRDGRERSRTSHISSQQMRATGFQGVPLIAANRRSNVHMAACNRRRKECFPDGIV